VIGRGRSGLYAVIGRGRSGLYAVIGRGRSGPDSASGVMDKAVIR
jgi:hypothetical protein